MAHADWLISGLEKVILPCQDTHLALSKIHLARSCKHCTSNTLKETKAYYAV